jgi:hypothetical protein
MTELRAKAEKIMERYDSGEIDADEADALLDQLDNEILNDTPPDVSKYIRVVGGTLMFDGRAFCQDEGMELGAFTAELRRQCEENGLVFETNLPT